SMYPNYDAGGTDPGTVTNTATEKFGNKADILFTAGNTYQVVAQVTVGTGTTGAYRVWVNGTLTHDFSDLQTTSNPAGWPWDSTELGGPQWVVAGAHTWGLQRVRFTTTNIATGPSGPSGPTGPSGPSGPTGPSGP